MLVMVVPCASKLPTQWVRVRGGGWGGGGGEDGKRTGEDPKRGGDVLKSARVEKGQGGGGGLGLQKGLGFFYLHKDG